MLQDFVKYLLSDIVTINFNFFWQLISSNNISYILIYFHLKCDDKDNAIQANIIKIE